MLVICGILPKPIYIFLLDFRYIVIYIYILTTAASIPQLSMDVIRRIEPIVDKVVGHILVEGQSETQVH